MDCWYPVFLNLKGERCLVVGGGAVAERKVHSLLECGARVKVVSPRVSPSLLKLAAEGIIELEQRGFNPDDLNDLRPGRGLIFGATDDAQVNECVFNEALLRGLAVNIVDNPKLCTFIVPSVLRRGSLSIAVSTGGKSPLLARRIREKLEELWGPEYEELVELLGKCREKVLAEVKSETERQAVFSRLVDDIVFPLAEQGRFEEAKERLQQCLLSSWE